MCGDDTTEIQRIREMWDTAADSYDRWYDTFEGAVQSHVDWELLNVHLPENKAARILDAAGGTGRISLPLARMGYSVTLCDISHRMLDRAQQKAAKQGLSPKIETVECDIRALPFTDESFDFVLSWDGSAEATGELVRVTKKGGRISIFLVNKFAAAIKRFLKEPESALHLVKSSPAYVQDDDGKRRVHSIQEARDMFDVQGVRVIGMYGVCGWLNMFGYPEEVRESHEWDKSLLEHTADMVLRLSWEPSVRGMATHLVLYGEKE
jgi:ubiquinone/menaquinone biosynthesis C-methylase UbiE